MSSCSGRMPVSMTATTTDGLPVFRSQARWRLMPPGERPTSSPLSK